MGLIATRKTPLRSLPQVITIRVYEAGEDDDRDFLAEHNFSVAQLQAEENLRVAEQEYAFDRDRGSVRFGVRLKYLVPPAKNKDGSVMNKVSDVAGKCRTRMTTWFLIELF